MAIFHPPEFSGNNPRAHAIFEKLVELDDSYQVLQSGLNSQIPTFTIIGEDGQLLFLWTIAGNRFGKDPDPFVDLCYHAMAEVYDQILNLDADDRLRQAPVLLVFPKVSGARLPTLQPPFHRVDKSLFRSEIAAWLMPHLSETFLAKSRVPWLSDLLSKQHQEEEKSQPEADAWEQTSPNYYEGLFSHDQNQAAAMGLELPAAEKKVAQDLDVQLVTGVAGSGKSLVLLQRLARIRENWDQKKALVLIHNRPILNEMKRRYKELKPDDDGVEWFTFMSWCMKLADEKITCIYDSDRLELIRPILDAFFPQGEMAAESLLGEIGYIKDHLSFSREDYLEMDRSGRGFPLNGNMRNKVYSAMEAYQAALDRQNCYDWWDVPRLIWEKYSHVLDSYDFILVDEAQFFAPIWFELVKKSLPKNGSLFLTADPSQGFLKRRQSWSALGLNVKGRSKHLTTCFRSTRPILQAATSFMNHRLGKTPSSAAIDCQNMVAGELPKLFIFSQRYDEIDSMLGFLDELSDEAQDVLVLTREGYQKRTIIDRYKKRTGKAICDLQDHHASSGLRICQIKSATGLEASVVVIMGLDQLFKNEQDPTLSSGERRELQEENTRLLYMAMTRACQKLVISCVGNPPESLTQAITPVRLCET